MLLSSLALLLLAQPKSIFHHFSHLMYSKTHFAPSKLKINRCCRGGGGGGMSVSIEQKVT